MGLHTHLRLEYVELSIYSLFSNKWLLTNILQRNKKITMLLVEYYRKLDMGNDNHTNYES